MDPLCLRATEHTIISHTCSYNIGLRSALDFGACHTKHFMSVYVLTTTVIRTMVSLLVSLAEIVVVSYNKILRMPRVIEGAYSFVIHSSK